MNINMQKKDNGCIYYANFNFDEIKNNNNNDDNEIYQTINDTENILKNNQYIYQIVHNHNSNNNNINNVGKKK